jgi:hypothetical protein
MLAHNPVSQFLFDKLAINTWTRLGEDQRSGGSWNTDEQVQGCKKLKQDRIFIWSTQLR